MVPELVAGKAVWKCAEGEASIPVGHLDGTDS
jgi:hypothetical protein